ncbi:NADH dehydrogenase, partial [Methylobacterium variabile]
MGIAAALAVLAALLGGTALTHVVERAFGRAGQDPGPAQGADLQHALELPNADRLLLPAGPVVALAGVALAMVVLPLGPGLVGRDLGLGLFYVIVVVDFVVLGLALAGWGANTPDGVEACYRIVAQLVAYVVPLGLAYVGVIMMARSLSTVAVVDAQRGLWFVVLQPLGFLLYVATGLMQSYRAPFLEPFAAS